jgi:type II secretory pathway component GspD/PulD (secretin)
LFRSESSKSLKKNLMIFVTPTIIDPAGNRYHSEDEMPFAQTSIPLQKPFVPVAQ